MRPAPAIAAPYRGRYGPRYMGHTRPYPALSTDGAIAGHIRPYSPYPSMSVAAVFRVVAEYGADMAASMASQTSPKPLAGSAIGQSPAWPSTSLTKQRPARGGRAHTETRYRSKRPMSRTSLNITLTAPLIRANLRQRLDTLAQRTDLPPTSIAARALLFGLAHLEADLTRLFPASATPMVTEQTTAAPTGNATEHTEAQQHAAQPPLSIATASAGEDMPAAPSCAEQSAATAAHAKPATASSLTKEVELAQHAGQPSRVTTKAAARALNKSKAAFAMHLQRHPELRQHARLEGRTYLWDLDGLRAVWAK